MKKILLIAAALAVSVSAQAYPSSLCKPTGQMAMIIEASHQIGKSKSEVEASIPDGPDANPEVVNLVHAILEDAYRRPIINNKTLRARKTQAFAQSIVMSCLKNSED